MRYALLLLLATGCNAPAAVDDASIIADIAVRYAAIVCRPQSTPTPDTPAEGCVDGCRCNGTGREKTGDGLSEVDCRCPADCECKPSEPPRADPPLVEVPRTKTVKRSDGRIECRNGTCYWVDEATGQRYRVVR
jgi:hypothetical protein